MHKHNTKQVATFGLLSILSLVVLFHVLVITGVVPYTIVWGGRLEDRSQMLVFELVSIVLNGVMLAIVAIDAGILKVVVNRVVIKSALWIMFALFLLNTAGNLFSQNELEKLLFTPLTLLLSIFSLLLALPDKQREAW